MNIFTPEDFDLHMLADPDGSDDINKEAAEQANEKLNKLIESWPVVYFGHNTYAVDQWSAVRLPKDIKQARLAFIEVIKPKCEKHEPIKLVGGYSPRCKDCGVELVAEWRTKE